MILHYEGTPTVIMLTPKSNNKSSNVISSSSRFFPLIKVSV